MKKGTKRTFRVFTERLSGSLFTTLLNSYNPRLPTVCVCVSLFSHLLQSSHRVPAVAHPGSEVGGGWSFVVFIGLVDELRDADQLRHGELRQTQTDRGRKNPVKTAAVIAQPQVEQPHLDASECPQRHSQDPLLFPHAPLLIVIGGRGEVRPPCLSRSTNHRQHRHIPTPSAASPEQEAHGEGRGH